MNLAKSWQKRVPALGWWVGVCVQTEQLSARVRKPVGQAAAEIGMGGSHYAGCPMLVLVWPPEQAAVAEEFLIPGDRSHNNLKGCLSCWAGGKVYLPAPETDRLPLALEEGTWRAPQQAFAPLLLACICQEATDPMDQLT